MIRKMGAKSAMFTAPASVSIMASATDDGQVTKVDFISGSSLLGTDTTSPYSHAWNGVAAGSYNLTARATDDMGSATTSAAVNILVNSAGASSLVLTPIADTFVRDGSYATSNFGTSRTLQTKLGPVSYIRHTFLKFDLATVSTVSSARLRLYGKSSGTSGITATHVYGMSDDSWSESGTTWNNKPASAGSSLGNLSVTSMTYTWYEWDVTSFIQSEKASGQSIASLLLRHDVTCSPNNDFNSREATSNKPQLVILP